MLGSLTDKEIDNFLENNITGRLGCTDGKIVYVVPVTYIFDGTFIIAHSKEGLKIELMRKNPEVCFEVDDMRSMVNWKSVIAWGKYEELTDEREKYYALDRLVRKITRMKVSETARLPHELHANMDKRVPQSRVKNIVYRIRIEKKSGRYESSAE